MLAKPAGGFRPINLFGVIQRLWTRVRREDARRWEKQHDRPYLYVGVGRSANNAAWMMAIRAEMAKMDQVEYAQVQLDLVKAFEYVPHLHWCKGAALLNYPRALLRLSLAAYTAPRRVVTASAMSRKVVPQRGIGAGSGLATVELKLLVIPIMDRVVLRYVGVVLTMYVDDTTVEVSGRKEQVVELAVGATAEVCQAFEEVGMEMSGDKNVVVASTQAIGKRIAMELERWKVRRVAVAKALGIGIGAGVRRCAKFLEHPLKTFGGSVGKHRRLL